MVPDNYKVYTIKGKSCHASQHQEYKWIKDCLHRLLK